MNINERVSELKKLMEEKNIQFYIVSSQDFHQSEYVGEYFTSRKFITGFTGSAGTALITLDNGCYLWTDGRYFLQAGEQLKGSPFKLMKMGEKNVPTIFDFIEKNIKTSENIGFDGRCISITDGNKYEKIANLVNGKVLYENDLIDVIWKDRPSLSKEKAFLLEEKYAGESLSSKLNRVRKVMKDNNIDVEILASLDDICWNLNIRGNDVLYSPLLLSYAIITNDEFYLYTDKTKFSNEIIEYLNENKVTILPYNDVYEAVKKYDKSKNIMMDFTKVNYSLYRNMNKDAKIKNVVPPQTIFKGIKNKIEIENTRKAEIMDSVAHVKFMKWLKENVEKIEITEMSAGDKLVEFRKENPTYLMPSFGPICSFKEHAAIVHYSSSEETNVKLHKGAMLMMDTGANFFEGTTDITRTFVLGEISDDLKKDFTLVAQSHLALANAVFVKGVSGSNLDILARMPFWERKIDFNHGTGHGVGYLLNVHEGPGNIRWSHTIKNDFPLEEGMIFTDEPGIYVEGSHGVRLENELLVVKDSENEFGEFMKFETITYVPFDLDGIDKSIMSEKEIMWLNNYHKLVYEKVSPYLNNEEKEFLKKYTRAI